MKAVLIPCDPNKPIEDIELPDNQDECAERVRFLIDGYFERVKTRRLRANIWCDEDGKMKSKPVTNLRATFLSNLVPPDFIVGDVVVTGGQGAFRDLPYTALEVNAEIMGAMSHQGGEAK